MYLLAGTPAATATRLPPGFRQVDVFTEARHGLAHPMAVALSPDGRVFLAEKRGTIRVGRVGQSTPLDVVADLSDRVHDFFDRGLMSIALHPRFPAEPWLYALYTHDPSAVWGDGCPSPPGALQDGCVVDGRLSRLAIGPEGQPAGEEVVLLEGHWCQQFPSHSLGDLVFRADGALCLSAGEGANFNVADYGQSGGGADSPTPANPCGDPPSGAGGTQLLPLAEGGALRSQDARTSGDPLGYGGSVVCIDPLSGAAWPTNPLVGGDSEDDRLVAHGLRNPFRMTVRPGTDELWVGDVGWFGFEEIDRIAEPSRLLNFGWPCYEGHGRQPTYDALDASLCESLYADTVDPAVAPWFAYPRVGPIDAAGPFACSTTSGASITGLAFHDGAGFPERFAGALFFADYSRDCLWVMLAGPDGLPDPGSVETFGDGLSGRDPGSGPVDLEVGPDGKLYLVYLVPGRLARIEVNDAPVAAISASVTSGPLPLVVALDATASHDPDSTDELTWAWDLDGDGEHDDSSEPSLEQTFATAGVHPVGLEVTDAHGSTGHTSIAIVAGNRAPEPIVIEPPPTLRFHVGQTIAFAGQATDPEDGPLTDEHLSWRVSTLHCPGGSCHRHVMLQQTGATGSFVAPDHEYPSLLELCLVAVDSGFPPEVGASGGELSAETCVRLWPETVELTFDTVPQGLTLTVNGTVAAAPIVQTFIVGSANTVSALASQARGGEMWSWHRWAHGGERSQEVVAPPAPATYTAFYGCSRAGRRGAKPGACRDATERRRSGDR